MTYCRSARVSAVATSMVLALLALPGTQAAAADDSGNPWGWGRNYEGAVGVGLGEVAAPLRIEGLTDVTAVRGGGNFSLELSADGTVWAHGDNNRGQLGDGTTRGRQAPAKVVGLDDVVAIGAGGGHGLAVRADGRVWAWGRNTWGQLGDGTTEERHTPVKVQGLSNVVAVSASPDHSLALKANGTVWAWGNNSNGELGDGTTAQRLVPVKVPGLRGVTAISTGGNYDDGSLYTPLAFSFAVRADGALLSWGDNRFGYLGDGTAQDRYVPTEVLGLHDVTAVSGGGFHSLAVQADGTAWAWGRNNRGQLGNGGQGQSMAVPQQVPGLTDAVEVGAGYVHSLALRADGTALGWGRNRYGETGIGDLRVKMVFTPTAVVGLTGVTAVDAGDEHSLAIADVTD